MPLRRIPVFASPMRTASTALKARLGVGLLGAIMALGCKESAGPATIVPCTGTVSISVNAATSQPRFSWTPACSVSSIVIMSAPAAGRPTEHWRVVADKTVINPPVTFGQLPTGAQSISLVPLVGNQDYHVSIFVPDRGIAVGDAMWHQP